MPGPYSNGQQAFRDLERQCRQNIRSTCKTRFKLLGMGLEAAATLILGQVQGLAGFVLKALPKLGKSGLDAIQDSGKDALDGIGGRFQAEKLNRAKIRSILQYPELLPDVTENRAGTEGYAAANDLIKTIANHYEMIEQIWKEEPFCTGRADSCAQAQALYQQYLDMDYHLSKMRAYSEALLVIAKDFSDFCTRTAQDLALPWSTVKKGVPEVLNKSADWHIQHCAEEQYCYRVDFVRRPPPPPGPHPPHGVQIVRRPPPPGPPPIGPHPPAGPPPPHFGPHPPAGPPPPHFGPHPPAGPPPPRFGPHPPAGPPPPKRK